MRKPWAGVAGMEPMGSSFGAWGDCGWKRCPVVGWGYWGGTGVGWDPWDPSVASAAPSAAMPQPA